MSNLFFSFIILFGCLYSHKCQIGALEAPAKRVANGHKSVNDRSFYVRIEIKSRYHNNSQPRDDIDLCGGTIISSNEVLTSRHCVANDKQIFLSAQLLFGDFRRDDQEHFDEVSAKIRNVGPEQIEFFDTTPIIHISNKNQRFVYPDLAIIYLGKVKIPMIYGRHLSILRPCPPESELWASKFGARVSAVGMGSTEANGSMSDPMVLQEAEMEITKTENNCKIHHGWGAYDDQENLCLIGIKCLHVFGKQLKLHYDTDVQLCPGDSGGPVFRTNKDGKCLVGVTQERLRSKFLWKLFPPRTVDKLLRPFQDPKAVAIYVTSVQKLNEWRLKGYFVSLKNWIDDQKCIENGTYSLSKRRYKTYLYPGP